MERTSSPAGRYAERPTAEYLGMLEHLDNEIGRLLARLDALAKHFDGATPAHRPGMAVTDAQPTRQRLEARVAHLVQIADPAIDDDTDAAERAVHVAVHLTPERADDARLVEVLHDDDLRSRHARYEGRDCDCA